MNKRLIDIAMEANDQTGNQFDLNYKSLDVFLEKFAELVAQECAEHCAEIDGGENQFSRSIRKQFSLN